MNKFRIKATVTAMVLLSLFNVTSVNAAPNAGVSAVNHFKSSQSELPGVAGVSASLFSLLDQVETPTIRSNDITMVQLPNAYGEPIAVSDDSLSVVNDNFEEYDCYCVSSKLNIRMAPCKDSDKVGKYSYGDKFTIVAKVDNWGLTSEGWVCLDYTSKKLDSRIVYCPPTTGKKSYERCTALRAYKQADLQRMAVTDSEGFRKVNGRYCVAVGTAVSSSVGTYFDIVLKNGTTINCIVGDIKADVHTQSNNIVTAHNGCASEFIVASSLRRDLKRDGDVSKRVSEWESPVNYFIVYDFNVFD